MLTYPWKCTVLHCNHLGNTWKPLVLMTRHFNYCPSASEGDNQSVRSSAPVVSRCFPGGYNVKLYISRGRLAWWLLAFLHSACTFRFTFISFSYTVSIFYPSDGSRTSAESLYKYYLCSWMHIYDMYCVTKPTNKWSCKLRRRGLGGAKNATMPSPDEAFGSTFFSTIYGLKETILC